MSFRDCIKQNEFVLMEGALGERLKREYGITFDGQIAMAGLIYEEKGATVLAASRAVREKTILARGPYQVGVFLFHRWMAEQFY